MPSCAVDLGRGLPPVEAGAVVDFEAGAVVAAFLSDLPPCGAPAPSLPLFGPFAFVSASVGWLAADDPGTEGL